LFCNKWCLLITGTFTLATSFLTRWPCRLEIYGVYRGQYVNPTWCDADLEHGTGRLKVTRFDLVQWSPETPQHIHYARRVVLAAAHPQVDISRGPHLSVCGERVSPYKQISTFSSAKANSMSRKSGLSKILSLESIGIERELPHHRDTLGWRCSVEIHLFTLLVKPSDPDVAPRFSHGVNIAQTNTYPSFHPVRRGRG
jgi:hypothetical protein